MTLERQYIKILMFVAAVLLWSVQVYAFDHGYTTWNEVLKESVQDSIVDYAGMKKKPAHLDAFLKEVADLDKDVLNQFSKQEQLAFWINVYNATTFKLVLDHYPPKRSFGIQALKYPENSLRQVGDAFEQKAGLVAGEKLSLNHIEHEILRKKFKEPRIHFALVCAAVSCPPIRGEAYTPGVINQQLADQGFVFINDSTKNYYSVQDQTLHLSKIFEWFKEDFSPPGIQIFVKKYFPDSLQGQITAKTKIEWLSYDWTLNGRGR